jgi:lycopene elongase/hydratase (dihydrobisanhydrobacterioruberin-forming)
MKKNVAIFAKALDCFFLCRPVVLIPVWGFSIFGFFAGNSHGGVAFRDSFLSMNHGVFLRMAVFSLSVGCVYVLNQLADIDVDKKNGGLPLIAGGIVSVRNAIITAIVTGLASVILPVLGNHWALAGLSVLAIAIGAVYSFKPAYLSGRPFFDFIANGIGFGIVAFGAGWLLSGNSLLQTDFLLRALPYFLLMCAGSISSTIPDVEGDAECGKRTTAVLLGKRPSHTLAFVICAAAAGASIYNRDFIAGFCSIAGLPTYVLFWLSPKPVFAEVTYKVGGALSMIAAAAIMPLFFLCGIAVFAGTWMYFRWRHGVTYPSLAPAEKSSAPGKTESP